MSPTFQESMIFQDYVKSFYGSGGVYDMNATTSQIAAATEIYLASGADFAGDTFDREHVRDIMIEKFGLTFPTK